MAKFVFTLEPVLAQRLREEREHERKVAQLERERIELEGRLRAAEAVSRGEEDDLRARLSEGRIDLRAARAQGAMIARAHGEARLCALKLAGVLQQVEQARGLLREAAARRRAVELLRDRQHAAWSREQARAELRETDEISAARAVDGGWSG